MRFEVEFNFVGTKYGRRAMEFMGFGTRDEAEEFAKQYDDANIIEYEAGWTYTVTGKKVRLF